MAKRKVKRNRRRPRRRRRRQSTKRGGGRSKFATVIKRLKKLKPNQRRHAIDLANNKFINQFVTEVKKLRRSHIRPTLRKRLMKQTKQLRKFTNSKTSVVNKRKMLQKGGFLPLLLAALPAVGSIVGGIISRT